METLFGKQETSKRSWRFWLFVLSPILVLSTCSVFALRTSKINKSAEDQARVFHQRFGDGQYDAIYAEAAPAFQQRIPPDRFTRYLDTIREKMGSCQTPPQAANAFARTNQSSTIVQLRYNVRCANGRLDETFVFFIDGGSPKLWAYQASSPFVVK